MLKKIATALTLAALLAAPHVAQAAASLVPTTPSKDSRNQRLLQQAKLPPAVVTELDANLGWKDLAPTGPEYKITFDQGAAKGYVAFKNVSSLFTTFSGTALDINRGMFGPYSLLVELGITGTIIPAMEATGWDITQDASAAANDLVEIVGGLWGASGRPFLIGYDPAFQFCVDIKIHDVDGTDQLLIGFREVEAFAAAPETYTDFYAVGNFSGNIKQYSDLNNAGEVTTDETGFTDWVDDAEKIACVLVSATGVATNTINGATAAQSVAYTFADGLLVIPFVTVLQDTNIADDTHLIYWEVKYQ